jgi:subtilisin family serine protease
VIKADAAPVVSGLSGKLQVIVNGKDDVNRARAKQCSSVAVQAEGQAPLISAFVHVDGDLDPDSRNDVVARVKELAHRVRWKGDTATVEARREDLVELAKIDCVAYIEDGLSLRAPQPTVAPAPRAPDVDARRISTCSRRHRYGEDVLVGIIDVQGFDFSHPDFLNPGGMSTRWEAIWDQGGTTRPSPKLRSGGDGGDFDYGSLILKHHMDAALSSAASPNQTMAATRLEPQSQMVTGSHGTHVASIAAGNRGVARNARLAGVLIDLRDQDPLSVPDAAATSFYDSTRVTDAVDFLFELAAHLGKPGPPLPVSINISLGTNGHAHDASSPAAQLIDLALARRGRCVSVAAGNAGQIEPSVPEPGSLVHGRVHAGGTLPGTDLRHDLQWVVEGNDKIADVSENIMEIWYGAQDRFEVSIRPPGGTWTAAIAPRQKILNEQLNDGTFLSVISETYYQTNGLNRITIMLSPNFSEDDAGGRTPQPITPGVWTVRLRGVVVRDGRYDAWIERDDPRRHPGTGRSWDFPSFFAPGSYTDDRMINSLGCSDRVIAVANVDIASEAVHASSSRGPTRDGRCKPDIGADGTDVIAASGFDGKARWISMSGTSMASPYVCGVAALMIAVHPGLTAAQIQGIIRGTSAPLTGHDFRWRKDAGFGLINAERCVEEAATYVGGKNP